MLPVASISRVGAGLHELQIKGNLPHPHWVVWLFSGLAKGQIEVVSGQIVRAPNLDWDARLQLNFSKSALRPELLDAVSLAQSKPSVVDLASPQLSRFQITRREVGLEVWIEGPDQSGFLGRLLNKLTFLMLFPTQITIATIGGRINDRIMLHGVGGTVPDKQSETSLSRLLQSFVSL